MSKRCRVRAYLFGLMGLVLACVLLAPGVHKAHAVEGTAFEQQDQEQAKDASDAADSSSSAGEGQDGSQSSSTSVTPAVKKTIMVTVRFVGTDGVWWEESALELKEGASAWDATRDALRSSGLAYRTGTASTQDVLVSVTRKDDGETASLDPTTGSGWHLYLNDTRCLGASSSILLSNGDEMEWRYEVGTYMVSVAVVGPGGAGTSYWIAPTSVRVDANRTAWDASLEVFSQNGYSEGKLLSYATAPDGTVRLESLAALGENGITGETWQVFVNGAIPEENVARVKLNVGDSVCWYYAGQGETALPEFVEQTGGASQNPATTISIEGLVGMAWTNPAPTRDGRYTVLDRISGVAALGKGSAVSLANEGREGISPLMQQLDGTRWRASLAKTIDEKLYTGEGVRSVMGLDKRLFYVNADGSVVKLELQQQDWE